MAGRGEQVDIPAEREAKIADSLKGAYFGLVGQALWTSYPVLLADAYTTLVQEALPGYLAGGASGILAGALLARYEFLRRGLLPYAAAFASVPIVALAPVAIHLLGLGWQSKALVAGVSVFFPVLVGTVSGLTQVKQPALDLFSSYSANQRQVFAALRFPAALPQIFNALKIASTLALIGAIVAEFFGSQGSGLGFRIQIEAGRFGFDLVWAAIAVASLLGIVWYGLVAALERRLTGWHPSFREVK